MPERCETPCPYLPRIEALEEESKHNKDAHRTFYERLEQSHTSVAVIEERLNQIKEDTEEIKRSIKTQNEDVQEMKEKPAKRWEGIVDKAIWAVLAAVIAFLLGRVGL